MAKPALYIFKKLTQPELFSLLARAKLYILAAIIVITLCNHTNPTKQKGLIRSIVLAVIGGLLFFGSDFWRDDYGSSGLLYLTLTILGYALLVGGISGLYSALRDPFSGLFAQKNIHPGFRQTEKFIAKPHSLHLRGSYRLNGRSRTAAINLINPRRGILIMGTPGSGKTRFIIEPLIRQLTQQGTALFVYDLKYPQLTWYTYRHYMKKRKAYPTGTRFVCINFADLSRTDHCNLLEPSTIEYPSDAIGISRALLNSINKTWPARQGDFFVDSPVSFLAALIWYLRNYDNGRFCTLPHLIEFSKTPYEELFTLLNASVFSRGLAAKFVELFKNKTMETLDGQIASARIPLDLLDSPDFYFVLGESGFDLRINDPKAPVICCLAGNSRRLEALSPIMSLFIDRLNKMTNVDDGYPSALVLDEFATVRATSVLNTIATGRSRNITTILSMQDVNQLHNSYTHAEADQVMNTPGNLICGQVTGETARWVKERFESVTDYKTTVTLNSSDTSVSRSEQSNDTITTATLASLSSGEFVGVLADDPDVKLRIKHFHAQLTKDPADEPEDVGFRYPMSKDRKILDDNVNRIRKEIAELVAKETKRIVNDPALKKYIVKR